jgi:predicted 2-oxoglutarate/Fe(II)-dependent dioxygenase YbiX
MQIQTLAPAVVQYEFPKDVAEEIVHRGETSLNHLFAHSEVIHEEKIQSLRTSEEINFESNYVDLIDQVNTVVAEALNHYNTNYQSRITQVEGFTMLRYGPDGWYDTHTDAAWMVYRVTSGLVYLNPSNYEGGETYFPLFDLNVKPDSPAFVLFPSNYAYCHQAMPVKSGRKDVLVTWMNDLPEGLNQESMRSLAANSLVGV